MRKVCRFDMTNQPQPSIDEILTPNDNCLNVPGEHCGSCLSDFEDSPYSDMNCCDHVKWAKDAKAQLQQLIEWVIDTEYDADYDKLKACDVCGDYQYSHAPDEHKEAGAKELRAEQRKRLTSIMKG